ncbi:AAA family ATPase [Streptomyces sp. JH34]|uniref:AAA family ATPase n=1 Tax=unclassified Streptomyces TaxID=2593676 RepID=UPI0023F6E52A|nr:AAA family ATPase [Streptomyces sp. JH34]MDF6018697.1 ATP-binding protein [Streptomyces sp. JH34]
MTLQRYATTAGAASGAMPQQSGVPARELSDGQAPVVRDLRGVGGPGPRGLDFAPGDVVVVSGLPGSGKSTLIRRTAREHAIDSQDTRDRWEAALPALLPYALYRPLVRAAHYAGLLRTLRSGGPVVVHDCGTQAWVRRWLAREARRRGSALHLVLLDVTPQVARQGQRERGRGVSGYAFARHRRAVGRLLRDTESGLLPPGCASAVLLDRETAAAIVLISFAEPPAPPA